jgi:hypothetical protein
LLNLIITTTLEQGEKNHLVLLNTIEEIPNIQSDTKIKFDSPEPWGIFFQDNATPQMEGLEELHNSIMFYLAIILFAVS